MGMTSSPSHVAPDSMGPIKWNQMSRDFVGPTGEWPHQCVCNKRNKRERENRAKKDLLRPLPFSTEKMRNHQWAGLAHMLVPTFGSVKGFSGGCWRVCVFFFCQHFHHSAGSFWRIGPVRCFSWWRRRKELLATEGKWLVVPTAQIPNWTRRLLKLVVHVVVRPSKANVFVGSRVCRRPLV